MRSSCPRGGGGSRSDGPRVFLLLAIAIAIAIAGSTGCGSSGTGAEKGGATGPATSSIGCTSGTDSGTTGLTVNLSLSENIQTVGIVELSSPVAVTEARVDFGRQAGSFEFSAPVDLAEVNCRTLLLGMKETTTYYVQVVARAGGTTLVSEVLTIDTGDLPNATPNVEVTEVKPSAVYGGFTINCTGAGSGGGTGGMGVAFIIDSDGDPVWAYDIEGTPVSACSRARMSFDGKDMWVGSFSHAGPDGALMRLSMDGSSSETFRFPGRHHDFTVLPNNNVVFQEKANGGIGSVSADEGPDIIRELDVATGKARDLYHQNTDFSEQIAEYGAHTNYVRYVPHLNGISFSMRPTSTIGVISYPAPGDTAELLMVFGGPLNDFDFSWEIQHGHEVLEESILIFNNNAEGGVSESAVLEYEYDPATGTGRQVLNYLSGNNSGAFGDVQRLPNGNTFVTYSNSGIWHEIDANGELVREMTTAAIGYSEHRKSLYGPPPP